MIRSEHEFVPYSAATSVGQGRVLILAPHPDDEVFGCGGSILCHLTAGDPVAVVVVTDGAFGHGDDRAGYARARRGESQRAARVLGYGEPLFWDLPDRGLEYGESLVERIRDTLETLAVDIVYAPSWWEIHPDHLILALATAEAVRRYARSVQLVMYEIGVPLHPNILLDITPVRALKRRAMACFESQLGHQAYDRQIAALNRFRTYTLGPEVKAAEGFRRVSREELRQDPRRVIRPGDYYSQADAGSTARAPLVSVLLVGVGKDKRLEETLESVALQTYPNLEILLVTPGGPPPDASAAWNGRYPLRRIDVDAGLNWAGAANLGLAAARGDYLLVVDGQGPLPLADHVASLMETVARAGDARCACADVRATTLPAGGEGAVIDLWEIWSGVARPIQSALFASSLYAEGCRFDETLDTGVDRDFLLQLAQHTRIAGSGRTSLAADQSRPRDRRDARTAPEAWADPVGEKWRGRWNGRQWQQLARQAEARLFASETSQADLRERLAARDLELDRQQTLRASLTRQLAEREAVIGEQSRRLQTLQAQLEAQELRLAALGDLRQEVDALRHSTSWRLTAPLRALVLWLERRHREPPDTVLSHPTANPPPDCPTKP